MLMYVTLVKTDKRYQPISERILKLNEYRISKNGNMIVHRVEKTDSYVTIMLQPVL